MLNNFVAEAYQHQDRYRLEYIQEYLDTVKHGTEHAQIEALEQIERTLLRIHNTYAIAWDFGGVLMDGHNKFFIELYARSKGVNLSREQSSQLWRIIFKSEPIPGVNYDALKIGQATPEQFAYHAIEHFNNVFTVAGKESVEIADKEIQEFLTLYYDHYDPKQENRDVLRRIKQLGIRQYGLTNNFMAKIEHFLKQHEFDYLQDIVAIVSERIGISKPNPRIYLLFKQHVFLDQFSRNILYINLPNQAIIQLWQAIFQIDSEEIYNFVAYERQGTNIEQVSQYAIEQYNQVLKELSYPAVNVTLFANQWLDFWKNQYARIGEQTIFVDDKTKNLDLAFKSEGILGVHYDANAGQTLANQPVIRELLEQDYLKQVVRVLRELTVVENSLGQRAEQALERLIPFRIRHEKLIWQVHVKKQQPIIDTVSDKQIYTLLQRHYEQLYATHFKLGQLVSHQYALISRLAILPEYTYDDARQIVLKLFQTSDLFLDQNRELYPWQETEILEDMATELDDIEEQSILKKSLLTEIKRKIVDYIDLLDMARQPIIRDLVTQLQSQADDIETLKQFTNQLLQHLINLNPIRVVQWQQFEQSFKQLQQTLTSSLELSSLQEAQSFLPHQLDEWYQQLATDTQQTSMDLLPLERMIADWEQEIHQLESTYFQQYQDWKILRDQDEATLYQDPLVDEVREQLLPSDLYRFVRGLMLRIYDLPQWKDLTKPTIILVSGASGSGKSTLSTQLAQVFGIQKLFSTDEAGRANTKAILDFLFGEAEAANAFPALYQSSFEGSIQSYYFQAILTMIGVEGLMQRLQKQNTSALIEGVGLMPGLLSEPTFELLNLDWLIVQVDPQQHWQHFTLRSQSAAQRTAKRYQANFDRIRQIHDRIITMGLAHGLTILENKTPIQPAIQVATERIKGPLADQFFEVSDRIRDEMKELLARQRQHLPVKVRFDIKRAAMDLGIEENTITMLLERFGFEEVQNRRHEWIRQPLHDVQFIHE